MTLWAQATLLTVLTLVAPPTDAVLPLRVLAAGAVQAIRIPLTTADFLRYRYMSPACMACMGNSGSVCCVLGEGGVPSNPIPPSCVLDECEIVS